MSLVIGYTRARPEEGLLAVISNRQYDKSCGSSIVFRTWCWAGVNRLREAGKSLVLPVFKLPKIQKEPKDKDPFKDV